MSWEEIHSFALRGDVPALRYWLRAPRDASGRTGAAEVCAGEAAPNGWGGGLLHTAVFNGQVESASVLLEASGSRAPDLLAAKDQLLGGTPLHEAAAAGHCQGIRLLLSAARAQGGGQGALELLASTDRYGETPLHWAARLGHARAIKELLEGAQGPKASDLAMAQSLDGSTPLHRAARGGHIAAAVALLEAERGELAHEQLLVQNKVGEVPVETCCRWGKEVCAHALKAHPAYPRAREELARRQRAEAERRAKREAARLERDRAWKLQQEEERRAAARPSPAGVVASRALAVSMEVGSLCGGLATGPVDHAPESFAPPSPRREAWRDGGGCAAELRRLRLDRAEGACTRREDRIGGNDAIRGSDRCKVPAPERSGRLASLFDRLGAIDAGFLQGQDRQFDGLGLRPFSELLEECTAPPPAEAASARREASGSAIARAWARPPVGLLGSSLSSL